jgi:carbonic anhydrase
MQSTRRNFILTASATLATSALPTIPALAAPRATPAPAPDEVLRLLQEGNARFVAGSVTHPRRTPEDFKPLAAGQAPIAAIIGCADSRVPPEILFDQGVGDLFVVRIAGNYVSGAGASVKGSVEYAVAELGVSLILVLGHSQCGAIKAAIQHLHDKDALPGAINDLVNNIKPAVLESEKLPGDPLENAIRANVRRGVERLTDLGPVLAPAIRSGKLRVAGAVYDLATGKVQTV